VIRDRAERASWRPRAIRGRKLRGRRSNFKIKPAGEAPFVFSVGCCDVTVTSMMRN
jgi:hypothetical protein